MAVTGGWGVRYYDIGTDQVREGPASWQYVRFAANPDDTLWIDRSGGFYAGNEPRKLAFTLEKAILQRRFAAQKVGDQIVYATRSGAVWQLFAADLDDGATPPRHLLEGRPLILPEVSAGQLFMATLVDYSADIFRTQTR